QRPRFLRSAECRVGGARGGPGGGRNWRNSCECAERLPADLAVDEQPVALLEVTHGPLDGVTEPGAACDAERLPRTGQRALEPRLEILLEPGHRRPAVAASE